MFPKGLSALSAKRFSVRYVDNPDVDLADASFSMFVVLVQSKQN